MKNLLRWINNLLRLLTMARFREMRIFPLLFLLVFLNLFIPANNMPIRRLYLVIPCWIVWIERISIATLKTNQFDWKDFLLLWSHMNWSECVLLLWINVDVLYWKCFDCSDCNWFCRELLMIWITNELTHSILLKGFWIIQNTNELILCILLEGFW